LDGKKRLKGPKGNEKILFSWNDFQSASIHESCVSSYKDQMQEKRYHPLFLQFPSYNPAILFPWMEEGGGITNAMGYPFFVIRMVFPVFFTVSKTFKQVALNLDVAMVSCVIYFTPFLCL